MSQPPLSERLTSRKFWLTLVGLMLVAALIHGGTVSPDAGLAAIAALITGYSIGNGLQKR